MEEGWREGGGGRGGERRGYSDPWMPFMADAPACMAFIVSKLIFAFSRAKTCCSIVFFVEVHLSKSFSSIFFRCNAASAATISPQKPTSPATPPPQRAARG